MKPFLRWCFVATALTLAGCSNSAWRKSEVLAVPLQPTLQQEVILARMEQILASRALTDDERAQLLYERGVLYDSLGLRALARNDFSQALAIRPDMPEVFNYLGIYLTQAGNFDAAYEAFDSVLELDPTYNYAHLNRGIALYYGGRDKLAQDDLLAFYQDDPNDPFRSLWLYLAEQKLGSDTENFTHCHCYSPFEKAFITVTFVPSTARFMGSSHSVPRSAFSTPAIVGWVRGCFGVNTVQQSS